jgi:CHAD domain-containing protein
MSKPSRVSGLGPRSSAEDAALRLLAARLADIRKLEPAFEGALPVEAIHDMRVACRRLRAAIRAFAREAPLAQREPDVKALQRALGKVRDLQLSAEWARGAAPGFAQSLLEQLPRAERGLRRELDHWVRDAAPKVGAELGRTDVEGRFGGKAARRALRKRLKRLDAEIAALRNLNSARRAHALRVRLKKLRYAAELLAQALPEPVEQVLARLAPLQDRLGELHDADVRLGLLRNRARRHPEENEELSEALAVLAGQRAALTGELERAFGRWRKDRTGKRLRRALKEG